jgi:hypothetical protein
MSNIKAGLRRVRNSALVLAFASCLLPLTGGSAGAATLVGYDGYTAPTTGCLADTYLQTGVATGASYAVPSAGVITTWDFRDGTSTVASGLKLKVGRLSGPGATIVGESAAPAGRTANSDNGHPFPARIPVLAGDVIGIYTSATGGPCLVSTANTSDTFAYAAGDLTPGTGSLLSSNTSFKLPVSAYVEPDTDGDGFGDESQDLCNTDPSEIGPCAPKALAFGPQQNGAFSDEQTFTASVTVPAGTRFTSVTASGDFVVAGGPNSCDPTRAHMTCQVFLRFGPTALGPRTGTLTISDSAGISATVVLSGTGIPSGDRAAALKKCKHKHGAKRKSCRKKAKLLPV